MKELMLVGVGVMGRPYLTAAQDLGIRVCAVETESWTGQEEAGHVDVHRIAGVRDDRRDLDEVWAQGVYRVLAQRCPDGILAFAEPHVLAAALAQDRLGLPGPSLHAVVLSRNKALQRACFASFGLLQPEFVVAADALAGAEWAASRLPVVLKPLSASGSIGVELVTGPPRLREAARERAVAGRVLVETAVEGPEFSWEGFVRDGHVLFGNVTAKETTGPPHFVEIAHRCGHRFADAEQRRSVDALAEAVIGALGMRTGVVHLEFRMAATGPVIMEVAVRTPGDFLMDLISMTYGFNSYRVGVQLALGLPVDLPLTAQPVSQPGIWYPLCPPGEVVRIEGLDEVETHPGVVRVALKVKPGDRVQPIVSSGTRIGCVLVTGDTAQERDEVMRATRQRLRIITR